MIQETFLLLLLALPFAGSALTGLLMPNGLNSEAWVAGTVALAGLALSISLFPHVTDGNVLRRDVDWLPGYGLSFTLRMDGFAWLFMILITSIGFLVVLYARYYLSPRDSAARFYACLLAFMGAMTGVVLAGNLILLVVFWELTSLVSFLLIGYWHQSQAARDGARMALIVTAAGGLCLLAGLLLVGQIVGSYEDGWDAVRRRGPDMPRTVNLITGPSRTGDIEQTIQLGAHGPRRLHILLIDGAGV